MAEDRILKCRDCGQQFTFTTGEQEFYAQKGFQNEPTRCAPCRKIKKSRQSNSSYGNVRFRDKEDYSGSSYNRSGYSRSRY